MKVEQKKWTVDLGWESVSDHNLSNVANLVFAFGNIEIIKSMDLFSELKSQYPNADIVISSTSGEIINNNVHDSSIVVSALFLEKTQIQCVQTNINHVKDSFDAGTHISADLEKDELKGVLLLGDAHDFNGDHLLTGIQINLSQHVPIIGGLSGGNSNQELNSLIGLNDKPKSGMVVAIGFSGDAIQFGCGVDYGWTPFGAEKFINRCNDNQLFEVDNKSIIDFYRQYLGNQINLMDEIPFYPLGIKSSGHSKRVIRTPLSIDESRSSITFTGNFNIGDSVRMMKTTKSGLISAAKETAINCKNQHNLDIADFVLVINCLERRNLLKDWSKDEIECVNSEFGSKTPLMGFYSHGEICPLIKNEKSLLHSQSLVIASIKEN